MRIREPYRNERVRFPKRKDFQGAAHVCRRSRMRKTVFRQQDCTVFAGLSGNGRSGVPGRCRETIVFD